LVKEKRQELAKRFGSVTSEDRIRYNASRLDRATIVKSLGKYWHRLYNRVILELTRGIKKSPQFSKRWKLEMEANVYSYVRHKKNLHEGSVVNGEWDSEEWMRFLNRLNRLHEMVEMKRFIDRIFTIIEDSVLDEKLRLNILKAIAKETDFVALGRKT